jgi:hypothetical protein
VRRSLFSLSVVLVLLLAWSTEHNLSPTFAQLPAKANTSDADHAQDPDKRLQDMRRLADEVSFEEPGATPAPRHLLVEQLLLHYSDADRGVVDGTLWAYGREGRPVAILEMYCGRYIPVGVYRHAWTATGDRPLKLRGAPGIFWTPQTSAVEWAPMKTDMPPAAEPTARLRQFKTLAKRFSSYQIFNPGKQREELRLLVQPLHRYSDAERHIRDGVLFALALGTNPEALLFLEARDDKDGKLSWHFGLARRGSSAEIHVLLDETEVWTVPPLHRMKPEDPFCHFLRPVAGDPVLVEP